MRAEVDPMTWAEVGYSGGRSHDMGGSFLKRSYVINVGKGICSRPLPVEDLRSRVSVSAGSLCPLLHRLFVGEVGTCILRHGTSNGAKDVVVCGHRSSSQIVDF